MFCVEVIKHVYDFMDKEIEYPLLCVIEKHLEKCGNCRQKYEFEKNLRSLVKAYCVNVAAPDRLRNRILEGLDAIDRDYAEQREVVSGRKVHRKLFSPRSYAIAASVLLSVAGGIFYYTDYFQNDSLSIVDNAVKNHVAAVNDNPLVFNEKTSVVDRVNNYVGNTVNGNFNNTTPFLNNTEQVSLVGGVPVKFCGTSSPCVIFKKGSSKLSLQTVHSSGFPMRNLERARFGPKEFYIGNCRGFNSILWEEDGTTYCLTSDIDKNEMLRFAVSLTSR